MKKDSDSEPVYGDSDKYIKTKIKLYEGKGCNDFHGGNITKRKCIIQMLVTDSARFCC